MTEVLSLSDMLQEIAALKQAADPRRDAITIGLLSSRTWVVKIGNKHIEELIADDSWDQAKLGFLRDDHSAVYVRPLRDFIEADEIRYSVQQPGCMGGMFGGLPGKTDDFYVAVTPLGFRLLAMDFVELDS